MTNAYKYFISTIIIPYGDVRTPPQSYTLTSGIIIDFDLPKLNTINVIFNFDKSLFSEKDAKGFSQNETYRLAYSISLTNNLSIECIPCHSSSWGRLSSSERSVQISGKASISIPVKFNQFLSLENYSKFRDSLEFYNQALHYNELPGKEKEVAFWIYHSFEALQNNLYGKNDENKIKNEAVQNTLLTSTEFNDFKNSIGHYYRHYKTNRGGEIYEIRKCLSLYQKILTYFIKSSE